MAFNFATPEWDSSIAVDKACKALFHKKQKQKKQTATVKKQPELSKSTGTSVPFNETHTKAIRKKKNILKTRPNKDNIGTSQKQIWNKQNVNKIIATSNTINSHARNRKNKKRELKVNSKDELKNVRAKYPKADTNIDLPIKVDETRNPNSHNSKLKCSFKVKTTLESHRSEKPAFVPSRKQKSVMSLRERMLERLKGARFRYLNEQMYTNTGHDSKKYFQQNPNDYNAYHQGYRQQVSMWPLNPLDVIIGKVNKMPQNYVIADFGCGEAKLAKSVSQKVHSFDLVAVDDSITACDMCNVPLPNNSVDVVVFCLSLMGTNLKDYLHEATRVLKTGGKMMIAEVESRFDNIDNFVRDVQKFGFVKPEKDLSHDLFWFLDFPKKSSSGMQKHKLPDIHLNPCLYKRR